jgi:hypothetical protein
MMERFAALLMSQLALSGGTGKSALAPLLGAKQTSGERTKNVAPSTPLAHKRRSRC